MWLWNTSDTFPQNYILTSGRTYYPNPGTIKNLHRKTREIMPDFFDGLQFSYKKCFSPSKELYSKWILSHTRPSGFRLGGNFNWKCKDNIMETPMIEAEFNPSTMASNLSIIFYPLDSLKIETKLQNLTKMDSKLESENNASIEYRRSDSTMTLSSYNASKESGRFTISYLRSINDSFAIGSEILFEWLNNDMLAKTALAARYSTNKSSLAATLSREALDISYWRQVHESIKMGTTLAFNRNNKKAIGTICYQWDFEKATVRGMVDSDWSVGVLYQRMMKTVPCWLGLSILFCIPTNRFACGIQFELDPSAKCTEKKNDFQCNS